MDRISPVSPVFLYAGMNVLALSVFAVDKLGAKAGIVRVPENILLVLGAVGPFGAFAAMVLFRHKTHHLRFLLVPVFLVMHLIVIMWLRPFSS